MSGVIDAIPRRFIFQGDNGAGIGASHQTGWTGCIALIIQADGSLTQELLSGPDAESAALRVSANQVQGEA